MNPTILLFDADSLFWGACCKSKKEQQDGDSRFREDLEECSFKLSEALMSIENQITEEYGGQFDIQHRVLFVEGPGNYRKSFIKSYKANRKKEDRPPLLPALKNYVQAKEEWTKLYHTFVSRNVETDDSIAATYQKWTGKGYHLIICSSDKDLKTIPCIYFDTYYKRRSLSVITKEEADKNFFMQMIEGDRADNVPGIPSMGKVKAAKILNNASSYLGLMKKVYALYVDFYGNNAKFEFLKAFYSLKLIDTGIETPSFENLTF